LYSDIVLNLLIYKKFVNFLKKSQKIPYNYSRNLFIAQYDSPATYQ